MSKLARKKTHLGRACRNPGPINSLCPYNIFVELDISIQVRTAAQIVGEAGTRGVALVFRGRGGARGVVGAPAEVILEDGEGKRLHAEGLAEAIGLVDAVVWRERVSQERPTERGRANNILPALDAVLIPAQYAISNACTGRTCVAISRPSGARHAKATVAADMAECVLGATIRTVSSLSLCHYCVCRHLLGLVGSEAVMGASMLGRTQGDGSAWWRMGACTLNGRRMAWSRSFVSCRVCLSAG